MSIFIGNVLEKSLLILYNIYENEQSVRKEKGGMDRRKGKTQKAIKSAFCELIQRKAYSEISIQDIIDEADVARATFYDHFKNKDEVLDSISSGIFAHVKDASLHAEKHHDFSQMQDFTHRIVHMLYHLSEDKEIIAGILASESHDKFLDDLCDNLNALFEENIKENAYDGVPSEIVNNHLVASLKELILWWIKNNKCALSPEQLADYYFKLVKV